MFGRRVNSNNVDVIEAAAEFASLHPETAMPLLDVPQWLADIQEFRVIVPLQNEIHQLNIVLDSYERAEGLVLFQDFMRYYRCIKLLAAEGVTEAMQIWPIIKVIYDHLRGKRGPRECPCDDIVNAIHQADAVLRKNKPLLLGVLNDQKRLEENLKHTIHQEDEILDSASENRL